MLTPHSWVSIKTVQNSPGEELVAKALFEDGDFKQWQQRQFPFPMVCVEPYAMRYPQYKGMVEMLIRLGQFQIPADLRKTFFQKFVMELQKNQQGRFVTQDAFMMKPFIS